MKHLLKAAMLVCVVTLSLTALSLNTAQVNATSPYWKVYQGRFSLNAGTPTTTFPGGHSLNGVAAVSASDVWAVGNYVNSSFQVKKTLIEHWNGKQWSVVKGPNPGSFENSLDDLAAVTANDIWAVGIFSNTSSSTQTLIEHWNGKQWSVVKSPNPAGSTSNFLNGIAVISASDIWAVGSFSNSSNSAQTLIEHWNGRQWSVVKSPSPGSGVVNLSSVAVVSTNNVWAVGSTNTFSTTLIEHWNGRQWSVVTSPNPQQIDLLASVGVVTARNIWAVGQSLGVSGQVLIAHWNGSSWSGATSPNQPGSTNNFLGGIAVISAGDIWAVGGFQSSNLALHTLTEHWNGSRWSVVPSP